MRDAVVRILRLSIPMAAFNKDRYARGAHTVLELQYHFVWKTKYSYPVLRGDVGLRLRELLKMICAEKGMVIVRGNVRANHVHMLISAPSDLSPAKMAQFLKGKSSIRLQKEFPELKKRYWGSHLWSRGYPRLRGDKLLRNRWSSHRGDD
jgi:putative transposase